MREITLGMCHGCKNGFGQFAQPTDRFRPPDKVASEAKFAHRPNLQYSIAFLDKNFLDKTGKFVILHAFTLDTEKMTQKSLSQFLGHFHMYF